MNIFICQTPFQVFYINYIIAHLRSSGEKNFIIFHSNIVNRNNNNYNDVKFYNVSSGSNIIHLKLLKRTKNHLDSIINSNNKTNIFMPHIGGLFSNYIFHKKSIQEKITINFYYEGILYFYTFIERYKFFHFKRTLVALALGFYYKYQKSIYPYNSKKIKHIYTPLKAITKGKERSKIEIKISQRKTKHNQKGEHYLILGGPIIDLRGFYTTSLKHILNLSDDKRIIYYKGHSSFNTHYEKYKLVFQEVAESLKVSYEELDINEPIEELLTTITVSNIYSYYSSALINIKLLSLISFNIKCYISEKQRLDQDIEAVFNYLSIDIERY